MMGWVQLRTNFFHVALAQGIDLTKIAFIIGCIIK